MDSYTLAVLLLLAILLPLPPYPSDNSNYGVQLHTQNERESSLHGRR